MKKAISRLFWLIACSTCYCHGSPIEEEIHGFTIDNTITRVGHDFARFLSDYRNTLPEPGSYNLIVRERPSARWGNLIWVEKDHQTVFRQFISPSNNQLQEIAEQAAKLIDTKVKQLEIEALFSDKFDMDDDEI